MNSTNNGESNIISQSSTYPIIPSQVIKNSISPEMLASYFHSDDIDVGDIGEYVKNNNLSLLLSVKEMVGKMEDNNYCDNHELCDECCGMHCCDSGYSNAKSDLQSLLYEEINKIKEI